ncbi:hypothetical protein LPTSP4_29140 [Leptospira ryugenii]|uniref:Uncharacterized protein n=1 Tax=Leptospira ryugenii TaxID=1917863 RepID=A0A2P2E3B5_9LEPT|nr:hypothetical protein [Leptospira ryugenii]GBF51378.1 hypothetical protein LPTSP4_29140 [Leptospira ryugenii]
MLSIEPSDSSRAHSNQTNPLLKRKLELYAKQLLTAFSPALGNEAETWCVFDLSGKLISQGKLAPKPKELDSLF